MVLRIHSARCRRRGATRVKNARGTIGAQHLPLRDQVLGALRNAIINGDYAPGERLTEDRLATDFGVSRNPVREALRVAETEGFVVILPRRGAVVASPTDTAITDIFEVEERLELVVARLVIELALLDSACYMGLMRDHA